MNLRNLALAGLLAGLMPLAGTKPAAAADSPLKVTTFTAKAKVTSKTGPKATPVEFSADYWVRNEWLRTEVLDSQSKQTIGTIMHDKLIYYWVFGASTGTKVAAESDEGKASSSFLDIAQCLASAKPQGDETVEDVACAKYTYSGCGGQKGTATAWIAKEGGWIKKLLLQNSGTTSTIVFRDVKNEVVPESKFNPPERVPFISRLKPPPSGPPLKPPTGK